jgi:hypothetical protein
LTVAFGLWVLVALLVVVVLTVSEVVRSRTESFLAGAVTAVASGIAAYVVFISVLLVTSY